MGVHGRGVSLFVYPEVKFENSEKHIDLVVSDGKKYCGIEVKSKKRLQSSDFFQYKNYAQISSLSALKRGHHPHLKRRVVLEDKTFELEEVYLVYCLSSSSIYDYLDSIIQARYHGIDNLVIVKTSEFEHPPYYKIEMLVDIREKLKKFFEKPSDNEKPIKYINEKVMEHIAWEYLRKNGFLALSEVEFSNKARVDLVAVKGTQKYCIEVKYNMRKAPIDQLKKYLRTGFMVFLAVDDKRKIENMIKKSEEIRDLVGTGLNFLVVNYETREVKNWQYGKKFILFSLQSSSPKQPVQFSVKMALLFFSQLLYNYFPVDSV